MRPLHYTPVEYARQFFRTERPSSTHDCERGLDAFSRKSAEKIKTNSLAPIPDVSLPWEQTPVTPIRREEEEAAKGVRRGSVGTARSHELIVRDPEVLEGKPFLAGSRMGVHAVIGYWQTYSGDMDRILREFPHLTREQIHAALAFYRDHETSVNTSARLCVRTASHMKRV